MTNPKFYKLESNGKPNSIEGSYAFGLGLFPTLMSVTALKYKEYNITRHLNQNSNENKTYNSGQNSSYIQPKLNNTSNKKIKNSTGLNKNINNLKINKNSKAQNDNKKDTHSKINKRSEFLDNHSEEKYYELKAEMKSLLGSSHHNNYNYKRKENKFINFNSESFSPLNDNEEEIKSPLDDDSEDSGKENISNEEEIQDFDESNNIQENNESRLNHDNMFALRHSINSFNKENLNSNSIFNGLLKKNLIFGNDNNNENGKLETYDFSQGDDFINDSLYELNLDSSSKTVERHESNNNYAKNNTNNSQNITKSSHNNYLKSNSTNKIITKINLNIIKNLTYYSDPLKSPLLMNLNHQSTKNLLDYSLSTPMIPSVSDLQGFSKKYGIAELKSCDGAMHMIDSNLKKNEEKISDIIRRIYNAYNVDNLFRLYRNITKDFYFLNNFTEAYQANYFRDNRNITKYTLSKTFHNLLKEFRSLKVYDIYYGDEKGYLYRAVLTPLIENFLKQVKKQINMEYENVLKIMYFYNKHKELRMDFLDNYKKISVVALEDNIFWAFFKLIKIISGKKHDIPIRSAAVSLEFYKNKMDLNLTDFIITNAHLVEKKNATKSTKIKKFEKKEKLKNQGNDNSNTSMNNHSNLVDTGKNEKKSKKKEEDIKKRSSLVYSNFKNINSTKNIEEKNNKNEKKKNNKIDNKLKPKKFEITNENVKRYLNSYYSSKLYSMKMYYNQELILDLSLTEFDNKFKKYIVDKEEFRDFCFPNGIDIWFIVCLTLFTFLVFQFLLIACIYTLKESK